MGLLIEEWTNSETGHAQGCPCHTCEAVGGDRLAGRGPPQPKPLATLIAEMVDARIAEHRQRVGMLSWTGTTGELDDAITMVCERLKLLEDRIFSREADLKRLRREMDALRSGLQNMGCADDVCVDGGDARRIASGIALAAEDKPCG